MSEILFPQPILQVVLLVSGLQHLSVMRLAITADGLFLAGVGAAKCCAVRTSTDYWIWMRHRLKSVRHWKRNKPGRDGRSGGRTCLSGGMVEQV